MRLHLLGLPHTQTINETVVCAFTSKLVKFAEMMQDHYEIIVYSGDRNDAPCVEHVSLVTAEEQTEWYGTSDPNTLPSVAVWDATSPQWLNYNARAVAAIAARQEPGDLILILGGNAQRMVADAFPHLLSCEWAAGYEGIFSPHVCFESYAWMHYLYGKLGCDGRFFDTVIPNFFRPEDFELAEKKEDYLLFVGRMVQRKGVEAAVEIANASGRTLIMAGSGVKSSRKGKVVCEELDLTLEGDIEYVGPVNAAQRNLLMGRAHALLVPTTYIEPFGAVAVEAQLCGTPAITTDFGAFTETVHHNVTGFRFRTLRQAVDAVGLCDELNPLSIRGDALRRFSMEKIAPRYVEWFERLDSLWGDGYYADTSYAKKEKV